MISPASLHLRSISCDSVSVFDRMYLWCLGKQTHWQGKTVVVCGASSGLGFSVAQELIRQRAGHLVVIARNTDQLQLAADRLQEMASQLSGDSLVPPSANRSTLITPIVADMVDKGSVSSAVGKIEKVTAGVDLVVQAVGVSDRGTILNLNRERLMELVDANLVTSLHAVQCFTPLLQSNGGVVVLIGSLSSFFAPRFLGGYSIAKHGLVALAQQSRLELAEKNIHVTLCCPGPIARPDAGSRYRDKGASDDLPTEAKMPGGGAKIKGLSAEGLSRDLLRAAWRRSPLLIRPRKAWWLRLVSHLSIRVGELILRSKSS